MIVDHSGRPLILQKILNRTNYKRTAKEWKAFYRKDVNLHSDYTIAMHINIWNPKLLKNYVTVAEFKNEECMPDVGLSRANREEEREIHTLLRTRLRELKEEGNRIE